MKQILLLLILSSLSKISSNIVVSLAPASPCFFFEQEMLLLPFVFSIVTHFLNLEILKFVDSNLGSGETVRRYYGEVRKAKWLCISEYI
jgi:hypothetical protein